MPRGQHYPQRYLAFTPLSMPTGQRGKIILRRNCIKCGGGHGLGLSTPGKSDEQMLNSPQKRGTGNILHPDLLVYVQIEIYHQYTLCIYDLGQFLKNFKKKAFSSKVKFFFLGISSPTNWCTINK